MRQSTLNKYLELLTKVDKSGLTLSQYCKKNNVVVQNIYNVISSIKKDTEDRSDVMDRILVLYDKVSGHKVKDEKLVVEEIETDDIAETSYERDAEGHIKYYRYQIYKKNKAPLSGRLTREEMSVIYRLYSYYGDSLTRRAISRHFPDLSLVDFKRILRAFNIYKDNSPFAPHDIEEKSSEELREIQLREKENGLLRKIEEDNIKNTEKLLRKYAQENLELKKRLESASKITVNIPENIKPTKLIDFDEVGRDINLYVSDIHLGAKVTTGSLYKENANYGFDEAQRRLTAVLTKMKQLGGFDTVNLVLMGDNINCSGVPNKTARLDHDMPENMDPREQGNKFIELMFWFVSSLVSEENGLCSRVNVYSVPCGNHGGNFEYMCNKALLALLSAKYPDIKTTMWEDFYGIFQHNGHTMICMHGKDDQYMKKGLPLNLDEKTKVMLYEWMEENNIHGSNIHFIKGDLHSNSLNSCKRMDYRNVLSLFGASDYSNYNFSRNSYGMSYDMFVGENLIRGTFENILSKTLVQ